MKTILNNSAYLPQPPLSRTNWPWKDETPPSAEPRPDGSSWPRISIVTPSYNQGQFIEETIRSVLLQGYPDLEYMIIDGGSTDETLEIIHKYEPWLAYWVSESDRGQSHAINKGWERASGDVVAYLNSDDIYLPGAIAGVMREFQCKPDIGLITGGVAYCDEGSSIRATRIPRIPCETPVDLTLLDPSSWFLPQSSTFVRRRVLSDIGPWVREDLHFTMDREFLYRAVRATKVYVMQTALATYRQHAASKTTAHIVDAYEENRKSFAYCDWGTDTEKRLRTRILRMRIADGYYRQARNVRGVHALRHLLRAALLSPRYLVRPSFLKTVVRKTFLEIG